MKWVEDIRRFLRDLDYYSIKRPTTMWSRLVVRNLWVALCLGFVCSIAIHFLATPAPQPIIWWEFIRNTLLCWPFLYIAGLCLTGVVWMAKTMHSKYSQHVRKELRSQGLCPHCRHSLRGNRSSIRCPECGKMLYG